jgi:quercetin dioxygenase-like cupin family protein
MASSVSDAPDHKDPPQMRRLLILAGLLALLGAATAAAAGHHGRISETVVGAAGIDAPYSVDVRTPADVLVARATVPPGASFGWHSHRAATVVVVKSGTLTLYDSADATCTPQRIKPGHGFVEQPDHVHLARNEGRTRAVVIVTYLGLKHGTNPDVPAPRPGNCPF